MSSVNIFSLRHDSIDTSADNLINFVMWVHFERYAFVIVVYSFITTGLDTACFVLFLIVICWGSRRGKWWWCCCRRWYFCWRTRFTHRWWYRWWLWLRGWLCLLLVLWRLHLCFYLLIWLLLYIIYMLLRFILND